MALGQDLTVQQALEVVREKGGQAETVYILPVVDEGQRLAGIAELRELVLSPPGTIVDGEQSDDPVLTVDDGQIQVVGHRHGRVGRPPDARDVRPSLTMDGGTTFHFTDEPVETVLARAFEAAGAVTYASGEVRPPCSSICARG